MRKSITPKSLMYFEIGSNYTFHIMKIRAYDERQALRFTCRKIFPWYSVDYIHKENTSFFDENEIYIHTYRVGLAHPTDPLLYKSEIFSVLQYLD